LRDTTIFTIYENIYYQRKKFHVLDEADWDAWKVSIKETFSAPYFRECWKRKKPGSDTPEFRKEIECIVPELKNRTGDSDQLAE
jgi:hypothetical protein